MKVNKRKLYNIGTFLGLMISIGIGFIFYFILNRINIVSNWLDYNISI